MPARGLVPGDLIELKIGDVVPADGILLDGHSIEVRHAFCTQSPYALTRACLRAGGPGCTDGRVLARYHPAVGPRQDGLLRQGKPEPRGQSVALPMLLGVQRGEINAIVTRTGVHTFFGTAASMINSVQATGHLQAISPPLTLTNSQATLIYAAESVVWSDS
jgi:magnesium-transporting ATPase (P-type)